MLWVLFVVVVAFFAVVAVCACVVSGWANERIGQE